MSSKLSMSLDDIVKSARDGKGGKARGGKIQKKRGAGVRAAPSRVMAGLNDLLRGNAKPTPRSSSRAVVADRRDGGGGGGGAMDGASVFVSNLAWETEWQSLKKHMRAAGEVVRADVMVHDDGRSRGHGVVEFAHTKGARRAIAMLDGSELDGREIRVREDRGGAAGGGDGGGGGGGGRRHGGGGGENNPDSEIDPSYTNSGVRGRNGWEKSDLANFVDEGPPPGPTDFLSR